MTDPGEQTEGLGVGFGDIELSEHDIRVRPCQLEDAIGKARVAVLVHQRRRRGRVSAAPVRTSTLATSPGCRRTDWRMLMTGSRDGTPPRRPGEDSVHRRGGDRRPPAAEERHAVGLERSLANRRADDCHQLHQPRRMLGRRPRASCAQNRPAVGDELGLNEQVAERRGRQVLCARGKDHFGIGRQLDGVRVVSERLVSVTRRSSTSSSGRDADLGVRFDPVVGPAELRAGLGEDRLVAGGRFKRRLPRRRPEGTGLGVADVTEAPPGVPRGILAPAGHGEAAPLAVPAARAGDDDVIPARWRAGAPRGPRHRGR